MSPNTLREYVDERPLSSSLAVGGGHALLSFLLWSLFDFEDLLASVGTEPLYVFYLVGGMFALGFVPAVLYARYGLRAPGAISVFLLVGSAFGTYRVVASGATPVDPTAFGFYLLLWPGCVVLYAVIGAVEKVALGS
ncbi:hypothetical protein [Halolamina sediminis]|uniref:hypothetical protein n=1 Tax=Halolamina sediminis TaxID=1480675 RepID=UPI001F37C2B4|nr:hypothetical protein [Halolamina sediminis]